MRNGAHSEVRVVRSGRAKPFCPDRRSVRRADARRLRRWFVEGQRVGNDCDVDHHGDRRPRLSQLGLHDLPETTRCDAAGRTSRCTTRGLGRTRRILERLGTFVRGPGRVQRVPVEAARGRLRWPLLRRWRQRDTNHGVPVVFARPRGPGTDDDLGASGCRRFRFPTLRNCAARCAQRSTFRGREQNVRGAAARSWRDTSDDRGRRLTKPPADQAGPDPPRSGTRPDPSNRMSATEPVR
jgi:hypothetical protein